MFLTKSKLYLLHIQRAQCSAQQHCYDITFRVSWGSSLRVFKVKHIAQILVQFYPNPNVVYSSPEVGGLQSSAGIVVVAVVVPAGDRAMAELT